jgi:uncharacterized protein (TIGR02145 family)
MKRNLAILSFVLAALLITFTVSCKKVTPDVVLPPPPNSGTTISDIEANVYRTVTIGTQVWMAENLKTTKYNDGTSISNIIVNASWEATTSGAWCDYNNSSVISIIYGRLYNWYAVNTGKLCPTGWHIPSDAEWNTLVTYLEGESAAGGKMKETGTAYWQSPNTGATNSSGFAALPSGYRNYSGSFINLGFFCYWWSTSEYNSSTALYRNISYNNASLYRYFLNKPNGFSVRCLKNY